MADVTLAAQLQQSFAAGGLTSVFVDNLGWEALTSVVQPFEADGSSFAPILIAGLKGFRVYGVPCGSRPSRQTMRIVDGSLAELSPERMEVFQGKDAWIWHWPRRTNSGTSTFESVETAPGVLPLFLAQRLTGLSFSVADHKSGFSLVDVRDRVHGNFDASNVTAAFYKRFEKEHRNLAESIAGVPDEDRGFYATTLLNRLMFLYFMQKKEFLNGDSRYLENTLKAVQEIRGRDRYFSFYKDALLPLFFHRLNNRAGEIGDSAIDQILGDVPYVNGGIFGPTEIEVEFVDALTVPDSAFEEILGFFSEFNWHLDTRPTGNANEINPEVIGYIFEQYINFAASGKKDNGAYYTPHDVTAHMVAQTLVPKILDDFDDQDELFSLLRGDADRFIQPAMLHGWDGDAEAWIDVPEDAVHVWNSNPSGWTTLDNLAADDVTCLPGETWVEMFHRRDRVEDLRLRIDAGDVSSVNDLITDNLNAQLLLTDAIDGVRAGKRLVELFDRTTELSVFDPTCGSGAFLFAALEVLEDVYAHIIDGARSVSRDDSVAGLISSVDAHPSTSYFIRKHVAIRNLYGTDLMPGAIETAKLRIFLSLAACVESRAELQPLPDLDFNLKVGNLVVGFKDANDVDRLGGDLVAASHLGDLAPRIDAHASLYRRFVDVVEAGSDEHEKLKGELRVSERSLRADCDSVYANISGIATEDLGDWLETSRPFHWFCEFPEIIRRGGFDVVVGNPPYVKMSQINDYAIVGYVTSSCSDLYAPCYERSLSLTHERGRHAFIVMASLTVWDAFAALRQVISDRSGAEWWATYGKIPAPLFKGVKVRNTIVILGPGRGVHTTRHHIHTARQRPWLFPTIEFAASGRLGDEWPVRGGVATSILERVRGLQRTDPTAGTEIAYLRPTASYWFPALLGPAPVLDSDGSIKEPVDERLRRVPIALNEKIQDVIATLGGKLTYLWWASIGDDFDVYLRETEGPRALAQSATGQLGWDEAVSEVLSAGRAVAYVSLNKQWYFNVRWNNVRAVTDVLDLLALSALGGNEQDWRSLNILYRQVMRSSGDSAKGHYVTETELLETLKW
jgi:hypothetical protein